MAKYCVLFNPLANNKKGEEGARTIENIIPDGEFEYKNVIAIDDMKKFLEETPEGVIPVLAGGDGTLNRFVNDLDGYAPSKDVIYYPAGSGNDFMHDISPDGTLKYVVINKYIENLPFVEVNGMKRRFINGIGYGIDGYCCEVGDKIRATSDKPINYAGIAIKGLLFHFKSLTATVVTDGRKREFKNVWLAPTMNGRFYGGGMNATPTQDRLNKDGSLTTLVFTGKSRLKTLAIFPSIFKGEHIKHTDVVTLISGYDIEVSFDRPCALQIDGETVLDVTSYRVHR